MNSSTFHSLKWMWQLRDAEIKPELKMLGFILMAYANTRGERDLASSARPDRGSEAGPP